MAIFGTFEYPSDFIARVAVLFPKNSDIIGKIQKGSTFDVGKQLKNHPLLHTEWEIIMKNFCKYCTKTPQKKT
jgi:hypothetical protein